MKYSHTSILEAEKKIVKIFHYYSIILLFREIICVHANGGKIMMILIFKMESWQYNTNLKDIISADSYFYIFRCRLGDLWALYPMQNFL